MKAEINKEGILVIIAENTTEDYAINAWYDQNIDGCTRSIKKGREGCFSFEFKPQQKESDQLKAVREGTAKIERGELRSYFIGGKLDQESIRYLREHDFVFEAQQEHTIIMKRFI